MEEQGPALHANTTQHQQSGPVHGVTDTYLLSMRDAVVRSLPAIESLEQSQEDLGEAWS